MEARGYFMGADGLMAALTLGYVRRLCRDGGIKVCGGAEETRKGGIRSFGFQN